MNSKKMAPSKIKKLQVEKSQLMVKRKLKKVMELCEDLARIFTHDPEYLNYEMAFREFQERKDIASELDDRKEVAKSYRFMAETCLDMKDFIRGLECGREYLDISIGRDDKIEIQRALVTMGTLHFEQSEYYYSKYEEYNQASKSCTKALGYFERAQEAIDDILYSELNGEEIVQMRCGCFFNRALCFKRSADKTTYLDFLEKIEGISRREGHDDWLCRAVFEKVLHLNDCGKLEEAEKCLKNILSLKRISNFQKIKSCTELAKISLEKRSFEKSNYWMAKALEVNNDQLSISRQELRAQNKIVKLIWRKIQDLDDETSELFEEVGDLCTKFKCPRSALYYYKKCIMVLKKEVVTDDEKAAALNFSIGMCYFDIKDFENAIQYLKREQSHEFTCITTIKILKCHILSQDFKGLKIEAKFALLQNQEPEFQICVLKLYLFAQQKAEKLKNASETIKRIQSLYDRHSIDQDKVNEYLADDIDSESSEEDAVDSDDQEEGLRSRDTSVNVSMQSKNEFGETELHLLCKSSGNDVKIQQLLTRFKGSQNIRDKSGFTPLHEACNHGQLSYVKTLHKAGANLDAVSTSQDSHFSPLISAALGLTYNRLSDQIQIINYLLDENVEILIQDCDGWNAYDHILKSLQNIETSDDAGEDDLESLANVCSRMKKMLTKKKLKGINLRPLPKKPHSSYWIAEEDDDDLTKSSKNSPVHSFARPFSYRKRDQTSRLEIRRSEATDHYEHAIQSLKPLSGPTKFSLYKSSTCNKRLKSAYPDEISSKGTDDWLDDDCRTKPKKRKVYSSFFTE